MVKYNTPNSIKGVTTEGNTMGLTSGVPWYVQVSLGMLWQEFSLGKQIYVKKTISKSVKIWAFMKEGIKWWLKKLTLGCCLHSPVDL